MLVPAALPTPRATVPPPRAAAVPAAGARPLVPRPASPAPAPRLAPQAPPPAPPQRHVWHGRYGTIVIEVIGGDCFVDGQRVEPAAPG